MVEGTDFAVGYYWFDADGKMTTLRNGPQADGCFYVNNERVNAYQLAEYEGDWYYICEYNKFAVNQRRYLNAATVEGTDFPAGYYDFDADGKMVIKNGAADDGYFYVNGVKQNAYKLVQYEGDWYFIAEYNKYAVNQRRYLNATVVEGTDFAAGYYYFGEDGEMTDEPEPEPAGKSLTKVTNENQIDEDNIGEYLIGVQSGTTGHIYAEDDYGADHGVWSGVLESVAGKLYATAHEKFIRFQFTIYDLRFTIYLDILLFGGVRIRGVGAWENGVFPSYRKLHAG